MSEALKALLLRLILRGLKSIDDIPEAYRAEIQDALDAQTEVV